jgi:hypothetical protein
METLVVECLRCGCTRLARRNVFRRFDAPECPRCGYLGWAPMLELSEAERNDLRERPVERRRRLRPVA